MGLGDGYLLFNTAQETRSEVNDSSMHPHETRSEVNGSGTPPQATYSEVSVAERRRVHP